MSAKVEGRVLPFRFYTEYEIKHILTRKSMVSRYILTFDSNTGRPTLIKNIFKDLEVLAFAEKI
jgi:hypothetical protein